MIPPFHRRERAFTLIELLTVIAVVVILAAILIPVSSRIRESSRRTHCLSNVRQQGIALRLYMTESKGYGPPDARHQGNYNMTAYRIGQTPILFGALLPYIGISDYGQYMAPSASAPEILICPSATDDMAVALRAPGCESTSYWINPDVSSNPTHHEKLMLLSPQTIAIMDTCLWWQTTPEAWAPENHDAAGFNYCRLDGSAGWLSKEHTLGKAGAWDFKTLSKL